MVAALARDTSLMETLVTLAQDAMRDLPGVAPIWQLDVHVPADGREQFGFKDSISQPAVEGTGILGSNPHEPPLKAGEFVLGYEDETGNLAPIPQPEVLGRNGTYVAFRKLHQRVAAFRQYLRQNAADPAEEEWLAAKFVGRWPSGAPLALAPDKDDPELGADPTRNNAFLYGDDPRGLKCPRRRARPADERARLGHHRSGAAAPHDPARHQLRPVAAARACWTTTAPTAASCSPSSARTWPGSSSSSRRSGSTTARSSARPPSGTRWSACRTPVSSPSRIARSAAACTGLPDFVVNRGGEYCFMPGLRALRWLADLDT